MGLSFSGYRKELTARGFRRAYEGLQADCPALSPFVDPEDLIAFFHDREADLDRKDAILFALITRYRGNSRYRDIAPLFIVLFTPALASIYAHARRRHPAIDREDLVQDLCLFLLQVIREGNISPYKVAARVVGELRNRIRGSLSRMPDGEFVGIKGDGTDEFKVGRACERPGDNEEFPAERIMQEAVAFLDRLVRERKITKEDRRMVVETLIKTKTPTIQWQTDCRSFGDFLELYRTARAVYGNITDRRFYPNPGTHCNWCDYSAVCGKEREAIVRGFGDAACLRLWEADLI